MSAVTPISHAMERRQAEAWAEWLRLSDVAHRSHDLKDGIAAGRAWGRFLALFDPRPRVQTSDAEIVPLRVR